MTVQGSTPEAFIKIPTDRPITGRRIDGTNPRSLGTNPRSLGINPRSLGVNPRALERIRQMAMSESPETGEQR